MKSGSKIHSLQVTEQDDGGADANAPGEQREQDVPQHDNIPLEAHLPQPPAINGNAIQDSATAPGSSNLHGQHDEEMAVELPGLGVHAPWPGLHEACEGCGAPSVSGGLGSGPRECEHCHRQIPGGERGIRGKGKGSGDAAARGEKAGKQGIVAVTSSREVALGDERAKALTWAGAVMLATSSLLLVLVLVTW